MRSSPLQTTWICFYHRFILQVHNEQAIGEIRCGGHDHPVGTVDPVAVSHRGYLCIDLPDAGCSHAPFVDPPVWEKTAGSAGLDLPVHYIPCWTGILALLG